MMTLRRTRQGLSGCIALVYGSVMLYQVRQGLAAVNSTRQKPASKPASTPATPIGLSDIFISVKTTRLFYEDRLPLILRTWFQEAREQTWFFTDDESKLHKKMTDNHMVVVRCPLGHDSPGLCCKLARECEAFLKTDKKWFCHFDDDNYVNVPRLVRLLQGFSLEFDWYLGKRPYNKPVRAYIKSNNVLKSISYNFATGGAGFCLSRPLATKIGSFMPANTFPDLCASILMSDDATLGYVIEYLLGIHMIQLDVFHSHYEDMKSIPREQLREQVSFSYSNVHSKCMYGCNVVNVNGLTVQDDPQRFISLHCYLFPHYEFCSNMKDPLFTSAKTVTPRVS